MFITLITDCKDDNAFGRATTRLSTLFNCQINTIGVNSDLEAAGNLIDVLDASLGEKGVILVNVAPRHKEAKKWENGTPFGYFYYQNILLITSVDGLTLSLVKKFNLIKSIKLMDIPKVLIELEKQKIINKELLDHIKQTQFRSFEFLPRVAKWLVSGTKIPHTNYSLDNIPDPPKAVWWVDNFGNCKTTLTSEDMNFKIGSYIETRFGKLKTYSKLKDVPDHQKALIIGSSGIKDKRFLEIIVQGKSAANLLKINSGDLI